MNLVKAMFGGLMLAAAPLGALAEGMSYSYVDAAYVDTEIDGVGPSADGFGLRGSVGFAENFFVFGEYADQSVSGVDLTTYGVGFGGHYGIAENLDLVGRLGWVKVEIDAGFAEVDDPPVRQELGKESPHGVRGRRIRRAEVDDEDAGRGGHGGTIPQAPRTVCGARGRKKAAGRKPPGRRHRSAGFRSSRGRTGASSTRRRHPGTRRRDPMCH